MDLPYHLASSSLAGETAEGLGLGAGAGFFPKRATILEVTGLEAEDGDLAEAPEKLRGFLSISETPREAAAVEGAKEAMGGESEKARGRKNEWMQKCCKW